jgi:hypothetical protein
MSVPYHAYAGHVERAETGLAHTVATATRSFARSSFAQKTGQFIASVARAVFGPVQSNAGKYQADDARHQADVAMLNRMARDLDATLPGLAAELRMFASRD